MDHNDIEEPRTLSARAIGVVRSPHREASGTPIQPAFAEEVEADIVVDGAFEEALRDLEGFGRIWLIVWMDRAKPFRPLVVPYRDTRLRGLFATRSPSRPNPIGLSVVRLLRREGRVLRIRGCDLLDGTPVLDIKPYVAEFDAHPDAAAGWLDDTVEDRRIADGRFHSSKGRDEGDAD
jgi:tRNA-Thr(GGU) m(6)t(6)A37 methyltransferase TsaA